MNIASLKSHRRLELSDHLANRAGLPLTCIACKAPLFGNVRARVGLWNNKYGAICDACYLKAGGRL